MISLTKKQKQRLDKVHREKTIINYHQCRNDAVELCQELDIQYIEIISPCRQKQYVKNRKIIAEKLWNFGYTYHQISFALSKDHSSIRNLINAAYRKHKLNYTREYYYAMAIRDAT